MIQLSRISKFILVLTLSTSLQAKDLSTMGDVYAIRETDLIMLIQSRVVDLQKSGQWHGIESAMQKRAMNYRDRPNVVPGLTKATETKSWLFDPSITLGRDITSPDGSRIVPAGTHVNPLTSITLSKALIFFDGDDEAQVKWVMSQTKSLQGHTKLILVKGSLLDQEKIFHQPLFFDQAGRLTSRFNIQHVPTIVCQQGLNLLIKEVAI
jgi:conjugal transfer pilus assembly protein TraW